MRMDGLGSALVHYIHAEGKINIYTIGITLKLDS